MSFENWAVVKLGDHTIIKGGKRLPKGKNLLVQKTKHPYIRLVDIQNGKVIKDNLMYLDDTTYDGISRYVVKTGDVCLAIVGHTIGLVFYITDEFDGANLTENAVKIECKSDLNSKYLYYYLISGQGQHQIKIRTVGSAQGKLPIYNVRDIDIPLPSLEEQENISLVLSALDDKIELNNAINKNLEEMAQALFKQWFVDFEFPNENGEPYKSSGGEFEESELGLIPKGWEVTLLGTIIEINSGKRPSLREEQPNNEYCVPLIGASGIMGYVKESLYNCPIIITGRVGTLGIIQRFCQECWPSDNTLVIQSNYYEFVCQHLKLVDFRSLNRGSTQPLVTQTDVKNLKVSLPDKRIINCFENIASSLYALIYKNNHENNRLTQIRDTLLPKLMSGEIRVPVERDHNVAELPKVAESSAIYQP